MVYTGIVFQLVGNPEQKNYPAGGPNLFQYGRV